MPGDVVLGDDGDRRRTVRAPQIGPRDHDFFKLGGLRFGLGAG